MLNEEGTYRLYDLQGDYEQHSLGSDAAEVGIIDAKIHESGMVAMTGSLQLLEVKGWEGVKPLTLNNPGELLSSWIVPWLIDQGRVIAATVFMDGDPTRLHNIPAR